jgi:chemotaxis protein MotA
MIDFATALGLLLGLAVTVFVMLTGADITLFFNLHAFIIIFGGVFAATLMRFPLNIFFSRFVLGLRQGFFTPRTALKDIVEELAQMALAKRKGQPLPTHPSPLLARGVKLIDDGFEAEHIRLTLERARETHLAQMDEAAALFRTIGEIAPAFGMIGTLIGMVQMFANMQDPTSLGPYMAAALLATLYSALIAHVFALPLAEKLARNIEAQDRRYTLMIEGIIAVKLAKSPLFLRESLSAFLPQPEKEAALVTG